MNDYPKQRHPSCSFDDCQTCLDDAMSLEMYLRRRLNLKFIDCLCQYRKWLDAHEIPAESRSGWPLPSVYEPNNIEAFIADWTS